MKSPSTRTGSFPAGFTARNSARRCSPLVGSTLTDSNSRWTIVYAASVLTVPATPALERLLGRFADGLVSTIAPDSPAWRRPFRIRDDGWSIEYRVDPTKRRIIVSRATRSDGTSRP